MDLRTVVTISALLLMTAAAAANPTVPVSPATAVPTQTNSTTTRAVCSCPSDTQTATIATPSTSPKPTLVQGFLTVSWSSGKCVGEVIFVHQSNPSSQNVCGNIEAEILPKDVCEKKGCQGLPKWHNSTKKKRAFLISNDGVLPIQCKTLMVNCAVKPDVEGQLHAYKVVTALLSCVLLVILLIRFTKPTVEALQRRFSDRRQNRWIGPTQSHSVSYHRGKTVKNDDREKRLSYPALERLAVSDSREPSSNRNSGCNY